MMIKTTDGEKSVASTGLAGTALGLAIPGTVALVNQLAGGNGFLGFGGNAGANAEIALGTERSLRYTDQQSFANYKELNAQIVNNYQTLCHAICELDKNTAVANAINGERINCLDGRVTALEALAPRMIPNGNVAPGWGPAFVSPFPPVAPITTQSSTSSTSSNNG